MGEIYDALKILGDPEANEVLMTLKSGEMRADEIAMKLNKDHGSVVMYLGGLGHAGLVDKNKRVIEEGKAGDYYSINEVGLNKTKKHIEKLYPKKPGGLHMG